MVSNKRKYQYKKENQDNLYIQENKKYKYKNRISP